MEDHQFDLFSAFIPRPEKPAPSGNPCTDPGAQTEDELIESIARSKMAEAVAAMAEAGRRKLTRAVPALAAVCRRYRGYGQDRAVPEQAAALDGLAAIGGPDAAAAVATAILRGDIQGPTMATAARAAAKLEVTLPAASVTALLRHDDPVVRACACACVPGPAAAQAVVDLLDDLDVGVRTAAAVALGRMGRAEGRHILHRLLDSAPTAGIVEALAGLADDDTVVRLGRAARTRPELADAVLDALDSIETPMAGKVAAGLRGR